MSDLNIDELIDKFGKNYPDWLNRSLGIQIASMDKTLKQIYGDIDSVETNVKKLVKNSDKSLAEDKKLREAIVKVNGTLEKISKDKTTTEETKKVKSEITKLGKLLEKSNTNDVGLKSEIVKLTNTVEKLNKKDNSSLEKTFKTSLSKLQKSLDKIANDKSTNDNSKQLKSSVDKVYQAMQKIANDKTSSIENSAIKSEVIQLNSTVEKLLNEHKDKTVEKSIKDSIDSLKSVLPTTTIGDKGIQDSIDNLTKTIEDFIKNQKLTSISSGNGNNSDTSENMEELSNTIEELTKKNKGLMETLKKREELDKEYNKSLKSLTSDIKNMGSSFAKGDVAGLFGNIGGALEDTVQALGSKLSPMLGNMLGAGIGASTAALVYSVSEIENSVVAYQRVTAAGYMVEGGLLGLRRAAEAGNVSLETMTNIIDSNRKVFLTLGVDAAKFYGDTILIMRDVNSSFSKFGYSAEQSAEFMASEMENRRLLGQLEKMDAKQAAIKMDQELVRMQKLSAAFGVSISDIQKGTSTFLGRGETQTQMAYLEARGIDISRIDEIRKTLESANMDPQALEMATQAAIRALAAEKGIAMPFASMQENTAMMGVLVPQTLRLVESLGRGEISQEEFAKQYAIVSEQDRVTIGQGLAVGLENNDKLSQMMIAFMASFGQVRGIDPSENIQAVQNTADTATDAALGFGINIRNMGAAALSTVSSFFTEAMGSEYVQEQVITNLNIGMSKFTEALNGIDFAAIFGPDGTLDTEIKKFFQTLFGLDDENLWLNVFTHPDVLKAMGIGIAALWVAPAVIGALGGAITGALALAGLRGVMGGPRASAPPVVTPGARTTPSPKPTTAIPQPANNNTAPRPTPTTSPRLPWYSRLAQNVRPFVSTATAVGTTVGTTVGTILGSAATIPITGTVGTLGTLAYAALGKREIEEMHPELRGLNNGVGLGLTDLRYIVENDLIQETIDEHRRRGIYKEEMVIPESPNSTTFGPLLETGRPDAEAIQQYLDGLEIPQFAAGGVAVGSTLANIAEASSPEMVLPLDPALHDMAKYIAEQHVEIAGPMYRRLNNELIYRLFRENDEPIDRTFTKSLNKFFFSKSDVENAVLDIQRFEKLGEELPQSLSNTLVIMNAMGMNPQQAVGSFVPPSPSTMEGDYAGTTGRSGSGNVNIASEDVYNDFMGEIQETIDNPYALAAIAATGQRESGFSANNAFGTWNDPSESGQAGTAGGIMSWRGDRYRNMLKFTGGNLNPQQQAKFFLQENPDLIRRLQEASSIEEASRLMADAWRFAGYNRTGGEAQMRVETARGYYNMFTNESFAGPETPSSVQDIFDRNPEQMDLSSYRVIGVTTNGILIREPSGKTSLINSNTYSDFFRSGSFSDLSQYDVMDELPSNLFNDTVVGRNLSPSLETPPRPNLSFGSEYERSFPSEFLPSNERNRQPLSFGSDIQTMNNNTTTPNNSALNKPNDELIKITMETNDLLRRVISRQDSQTTAIKNSGGIIV
jgi:hypothetical protein